MQVPFLVDFGKSSRRVGDSTWSKLACSFIAIIDKGKVLTRKLRQKTYADKPFHYFNVHCNKLQDSCLLRKVSYTCINSEMIQRTAEKVIQC
jgi:hypothetical protein